MPVGYIYISTSDVSPAYLFGGTWERILQRFLLGADGGDTWSTGGVTGGSRTVTLENKHMPKYPEVWTPNGGYYGSSIGVKNSISPGTYWGFHSAYLGNGEEHENMPPYLAVYMWKRTA